MAPLKVYDLDFRKSINASPRWTCFALTLVEGLVGEQTVLANDKNVLCRNLGHKRTWITPPNRLCYGYSWWRVEDGPGLKVLILTSRS